MVQLLQYEPAFLLHFIVTLFHFLQKKAMALPKDYAVLTLEELLAADKTIKSVNSVSNYKP